MISRSRIVVALSVMLAIAVGSTFADDKKPNVKTKPAKPKASIAGTVIGNSGRPFQSAEIRAQRVDTKAAEMIAITDSKGRYFFAGLPAGAYSVTAYADGLPLSRAQIKTQTTGWVKLDFDFRLDRGDQADRMQSDFHTIRYFNVGNPH